MKMMIRPYTTNLS